MDKHDQKNSPPYGNTGAENTSESGLRALVDWVGITLKNVQSVHDVCDLLGIDFSQFREAPKGGMGYLKSLRFGGISIFYDGKDDMGIHIEMTGQGCRHFEKYSRYSWVDFFAIILNLDIKVSRLDLAIDDFHGYFTLAQVRDRIRRKLVRSRFRDAVEIRKTRLGTGEIRGETIYFGSAKSMIQIRMYNKFLEREEQGFKVNDAVKHWVRTEIQMRDERAKLAVLLMVSQISDTGKLAAGILKNYLNFLIPGKDKNKNRWKVCKWWEEFLGDVAKLRLTVLAPDMTIERSYQWAYRQWLTTMGMLYEAFNQDVRLFFDLINEGLNKMEDKHKDVVQRFKDEYGNISYEDFVKKIKAQTDSTHLNPSEE